MGTRQKVLQEHQALSSPAPESKVVKAIKGRVLTPGKQKTKASPVLAKRKVYFGGAPHMVQFEGSCPLCEKKFVDAMLLETHASECIGDGEAEQVTHFVFHWNAEFHLACRILLTSAVLPTILG